MFRAKISSPSTTEASNQDEKSDEDKPKSSGICTTLFPQNLNIIEEVCEIINKLHIEPSSDEHLQQSASTILDDFGAHQCTEEIIDTNMRINVENSVLVNVSAEHGECSGNTDLLRAFLKEENKEYVLDIKEDDNKPHGKVIKKLSGNEKNSAAVKVKKHSIEPLKVGSSVNASSSTEIVPRNGKSASKTMPHAVALGYTTPYSRVEKLKIVELQQFVGRSTQSSLKKRDVQKSMSMRELSNTQMIIQLPKSFQPQNLKKGKPHLFLKKLGSPQHVKCTPQLKKPLVHQPVHIKKKNEEKLQPDQEKLPGVPAAKAVTDKERKLRLSRIYRNKLIRKNPGKLQLETLPQLDPGKSHTESAMLAAKKKADRETLSRIYSSSCYKTSTKLSRKLPGHGLNVAETVKGPTASTSASKNISTSSRISRLSTDQSKDTDIVARKLVKDKD